MTRVLNPQRAGIQTGAAYGHANPKYGHNITKVSPYTPAPPGVDDDGFMGNDSGIVQGLLPKARMTHSEWLYHTLRPKVLNENPTEAARHYQQDKQIFWKSFADTMRDKPQRLQTTLYLYMADMKSWVFEFFPVLEKWDVVKIIQTTMSTEPTMPSIGTRKIPPRRISARMSVVEYNTILTKQGFSMDYHFLNFDPAAMQTWDMMVDAVVANIWSYVIFLALTEMMNTPSRYNEASMLFPYNEVPDTVDKYLAWERNNLLLINKQPMAMNTIINNVDKVLQQQSRVCTGFVMSRDVAWFASARDPLMNIVSSSGPMALRNRATAGRKSSVAGVTLYPVPLARGVAHDDFYRTILRDRFQTGGWGRSPENTLGVPAHQYMSKMRFVGLPSITKNGFHRYSLLDVLRHCVDFYPINFGAEQGKRYKDDDATPAALLAESSDANTGYAGEINVGLLYTLIAQAPEVFHKRMGTRLATNESTLHTFLRRTEKTLSKEGVDQRYAPVRVFGEISRAYMKADYLSGMFDSFEHKLCSDLTKDHISKFERGLRLADEMNAAGLVDVQNLAAFIGGEVVWANAEITGRDKEHQYSTLGVQMHDPNRHGGPTLDRTAIGNAFVSATAEKPFVQWRPYGMGNIAGFLTVAEIAASTRAEYGTSFFNDNDVRTIREFLPVYRQVMAAAGETTYMHPCLSAMLVPLHHHARAMSHETKQMIVFWYTVVRPFTAPLMTGAGVLTQFASTGAQNTRLVAGLFPDDNNVRSLSHRIVFDANPSARVQLDVLQARSFGGTLFTALPYVHPRLPAMSGSSGKITRTLRSIPEAANLISKDVEVSRTRVSEWRDRVDETTMANAAAGVYTRKYYKDMRTFAPLFPKFIAHMLANPIAVHDDNHVTDMEIRLMRSHHKTMLRGISERFALFAQVTLQTIERMHENNIRIPLGATLLRHTEEQYAESGIAIALAPGASGIGTTVFSGIFNNVSFDAGSQHFNIQAWARTRTVVSDTAGYLEQPLLAGGVYTGGKSHLFINQNDPRPITELEDVVEAVQTCNARALGNRCVIACVASLNSAVEKVKYTCFDVRNSYRKENFVGLMSLTARDFVQDRTDLAYDGAPLLNTIFDWDNGEGMLAVGKGKPNMIQRNAARSRNYVVRMTTNQIWDRDKGIVHTPSDHLWGNLETSDLLYTQQSYADVGSVE
jgi:hypothetical protein